MAELKKQARYAYTPESCPTIKKNELISLVGTWMNLEMVMVSKISPILKGKYAMHCLLYGNCGDFYNSFIFENFLD